MISLVCPVRNFPILDSNWSSVCFFFLEARWYCLVFIFLLRFCSCMKKIIKEAFCKEAFCSLFPPDCSALRCHESHKADGLAGRRRRRKHHRQSSGRVWLTLEHSCLKHLEPAWRPPGPHAAHALLQLSTKNNACTLFIHPINRYISIKKNITHHVRTSEGWNHDTQVFFDNPIHIRGKIDLGWFWLFWLMACIFSLVFQRVKANQLKLCFNQKRIFIHQQLIRNVDIARQTSSKFQASGVCLTSGWNSLSKFSNIVHNQPENFRNTGYCPDQW